MSLPDKTVASRIIDDVADTLATVQQGAGPGYHIDLIPLRPTSRIGTTWQHGTAMIFIRGSEPDNPEDAPQHIEARILRITVQVLVVESDASEMSLDDQMYTVAGDVVYALCETQPVRERNNLAINTIPGEVTFYPREDDANMGFVDIDFDIPFWTLFGNAFDSPHED